MIKVVHITASSTVGAGIAALRLHNALQENGIMSAYISKNLTLDFNNKIVKDPILGYKKAHLFKRVFIKLMSFFYTSKAQKFSKKITHHKKDSTYEIVSSPYSKYVLVRHPLVKEATIINLHWIGLVVDFATFFKQITKPIVWTIHDANPYMGIFHYKNDKEANLHLKEIEEEAYKLKKLAVDAIVNLTIVSPSQWLMKEALNSRFFNKSVNFKSISNCISFDSDISTNLLQRELGIKNNENCLLCVAGSLTNYRKGMDLLVQALNLVSIPITLLTIGKGTLQVSNKSVKVISLGYLEDEFKIRSYYSLADAFVLPSREDNLPNTMLESLSVGTPVLGFAIGGLQEHIVDYKNGMLAKSITPKSLATVIVDFFTHKNDFNSLSIIKKTKETFSPLKQARLYTNIYNDIV